MTELREGPLDEDAAAAVSVSGISSAAIFAADPRSAPLRLVAAAGIAGPALTALEAAVRNPAHPVARALGADGPTFDVLPTAPGGPRLRSHFPLHVQGASGRQAVGVLAVAHDT